MREGVSHLLLLVREGDNLIIEYHQGPDESLHRLSKAEPLLRGLILILLVALLPFLMLLLFAFFLILLHMDRGGRGRVHGGVALPLGVCDQRLAFTLLPLLLPDGQRPVVFRLCTLHALGDHLAQLLEQLVLPLDDHLDMLGVDQPLGELEHRVSVVRKQPGEPVEEVVAVLAELDCAYGAGGQAGFELGWEFALLFKGVLLDGVQERCKLRFHGGTEWKLRTEE
jgi:hypothetical protein